MHGQRAIVTDNSHTYTFGEASVMPIAKPFASWNSFWAFTETVRYHTRFIHDRRVRAFLAAVAASAAGRVFEVPQGKALWRLYVCHYLEERQKYDIKYVEPIPCDSVRIKPLTRTAHEGRVNPRGIPCLYAANNKETAVAEVRPWLGALVYVAQLSPTRTLRLVNCSEGHDSKFELYFEEPAPELR